MNVKDILPQLKEKAGKISTKSKKIILISAAAVLIFAVVVAVLINHKNYTVLYSGVNSEEASEIVSKLQESGVDYQYKQNGDVLVDEKQADQVRAQLAQEGYPKSGFSYGIFIENAGGMTTDSDKQTYKLYELQNRIGATIGLFDGVKDAKVTIALGEKQRYVLQDDDMQKDSSASVVVIMKDGGSPTKNQAAAIQRLVARSVAGMPLENVSVFDGNGLDISAQLDMSGTENTGNSEELAQLVEGQITAKIMNLLGAVYGSDNVRVSVKCRINMEELIRETLTYTTPDKIDETDKTGIVSRESIAEETSDGVAAAGGVAGAETNADVTQYAGNTGNGGTNSYYSSDATREFVINQVKEQGQVPAGALEDLTISAAVNGKDFGELTQQQLKALIGNAAGIAKENQDDKITVVSAPFFKTDGGQQPAKEFVAVIMEQLRENPLMLAIGAGILLFLILLITVMILLAVRRRKKRKRLRATVRETPVTAAVPDYNPEITKMQNEKAHGLREDIRDFAEQNPEISAQLLKNWLNGGEEHGS